jgi:hypothetical protein
MADARTRRRAGGPSPSGSDIGAAERGSSDAETVPPLWFAVGLLVLAGMLVVNTVLGPLVLSVISYPFSETVENETIGLEAISLVLVAPSSALAGLLVLRGRPIGAVLAMGPAGYTAYMFVQYVAGPGYPTYQASLLLHVVIFTLASALLLQAWHSARPVVEPLGTGQRDRRWAGVLAGLAAFVVFRWAEALARMLEGGPLDDAYVADAGMYWSIFLLDLGVVVPVTVVAAVGLWRGRRWARTALFGLVGWFALVPPSVTAMAITKIIRDDPLADPADTVVLGVATVVFAAIAVLLYRPLLKRPRPTGV